MPMPTIGRFAQHLYEAVRPLQFAEPEFGVDYALAKLCGAYGVTAEDIEQLARDSDEGDPGWSIILDINRCPAVWLPWLGQLVGVEVDPVLSEDEQRQQIRDEENMRRGTVQDMIVRIKRHLVGRKIVILRERDYSPYHFSVVLYTDDTGVVTYIYQNIYDGWLFAIPGPVNPAVTYNDVFLGISEYGILYNYGIGAEPEIIAELEKRPAPLQYRLAVLGGQDYWEVWQDYLEYQDVYDAYATYQELFDDAPIPHPFPFEELLWHQTYKLVYNTFQTYQTIWDRETTY